MLDITMVHSASRTRLIRLFPTVFKDTDVNLDEVTVDRARTITVESPPRDQRLRRRRFAAVTRSIAVKARCHPATGRDRLTWRSSPGESMPQVVDSRCFAPLAVRACHADPPTTRSSVPDKNGITVRSRSATSMGSPCATASITPEIQLWR